MSLQCIITVNKQIVDSLKAATWREAMKAYGPMIGIIGMMAFMWGWIYAIVAIAIYLELNAVSFTLGLYVVSMLVVMVFIIFYVWAIVDECRKEASDGES